MNSWILHASWQSRIFVSFCLLSCSARPDVFRRDPSDFCIVRVKHKSGWQDLLSPETLPMWLMWSCPANLQKYQQMGNLQNFQNFILNFNHMQCFAISYWIFLFGHTPPGFLMAEGMICVVFVGFCALFARMFRSHRFMNVSLFLETAKNKLKEIRTKTLETDSTLPIPRILERSARHNK